MRYWAAIGLRCQATDALSPVLDDLMTLLSDDYPPVRIIGAAILWQHHQVPKALDHLRHACLDPDPHPALMAFQQIQLLGDLLPFTEEIEAVSAGRGATDDYNLEAVTDILRWRLGQIDRPILAQMR